MQQFLSNSYLFGGNAPFVEQLYEDWLDQPQSVPQQWREYFERLQLLPAPAGKAQRDVAHAPIVESFAQRARAGAARPGATSSRSPTGPEAHGRCARPGRRGGDQATPA